MATSITPTILRARYPEFRKASDTITQGAIDLAVTALSESVFSSMYDEAVLHYACDVLFNSANGRPMQFDNKDNAESPYLKVFKRLQHKAATSYNFLV